MELIVPDFAGGLRFALDAVLAGLVVRQRLGAGRNAAFANVRHSIDGFVVFVGLYLYFCVLIAFVSYRIVLYRIVPYRIVSYCIVSYSDMLLS